MRVLSATFFALVLLAISFTESDAIGDLIKKGAEEIQKGGQKALDTIANFGKTATKEVIGGIIDAVCKGTGDAGAVMFKAMTAGCDKDKSSDKFCSQVDDGVGIYKMICSLINEHRQEIIDAIFDCLHDNKEKDTLKCFKGVYASWESLYDTMETAAKTGK